MNRAALWLTGFALLALIGCGGKPAPKEQMEVAFWYWHSPLKLNPETQASLKRMKVKQLFVRAGTFSNDGKGLVLALPQSYAGSIAPLKAHLVFNFDSGALSHFEDFTITDMALAMAVRIGPQVDRAQRAGVEVIGVQLDIDCPTRLLPRYAELVRELRVAYPELKKGGPLQLSATGLMSWLGSDGLKTLSNELDFLCPQAYEGQTGMTLDAIRPISNAEALKKRIPLAGQLDCPIYIGLPSYGRATLYNEKGRLVQIYRGLAPEDALRHPSFKVIDAYPTRIDGKPAHTKAEANGEEIMIFKAVRPTPTGEGLGFSLVYNIPTWDMLRKMAEAAESARPANCKGVILFRVPEEDESLAMPIDTVQGAMNDFQVLGKPHVKVSARKDAFEVLESARSEAPMDVFGEFTLRSGIGTFIGNGAIVVLVSFDQVGIENASLGDALQVEFGVVDSGGRWTQSRPATANSARFLFGYAHVGKKLEFGPVRHLKSNVTTATIRTTVRLSNGFDVETFGPDVHRLGAAVGNTR